MTVSKPGMSYRDAGVDIDAGNELVQRIKKDVAATHRPGVIGSIGGFGGLFEIDTTRYKRPILVGATDGVGTKLRLALSTGIHDSIGIDLVAMCVNDVIVQGAEPLFFLDYFATAKLDVDIAADVVKGIAAGCKIAGAALIGGETAEMPGMYRHGDYDVAGFCVGIVEKDNLLDGHQVAAGDKLIGLAASGPHSNGYSLIRRIIDSVDNSQEQILDDGQTVVQACLAPTRIYVRSVLTLLEKIQVHAVAHITGGGLTENLPRVLPQGCRAKIDRQSWQQPAIFNWLQSSGNVAQHEMLRTFNCGIGMIVVVAAGDADAAVASLKESGEQPWLIGEVVEGQPGVDFSE